MQNSLNQAFIKAYAKERDATQSRHAIHESDAIAADQRVKDELILRIDTTSVDIPKPHLSRQGTRQTSVASTTRPQLATSSHRQPLPAVPQDKPAEPSSDDELRSRIAAEMMRAGEWQSEQIASLSISMPSLAKELGHPTAPAAPKELTASLLGEPSPFPQEDRDSAPPTYVGRGSSVAASYAQVAQPTKPGSIVRLDVPPEALPTRVEPRREDSVATVAAKAEPRANSKRETIKVFVPKAPMEMAPAEAAEQRHTNARAETKQVESQLRQAKVRVFNPVWEVDQLQWPEVCQRLLEARVDSLSHVTKHLIDACQEGLQVLAVTSPQGGEGRTTVACCLAMLAGSRGLKVAIVDGDVENPTLSLQTNLEIENDWQMALTNHLPLEEISVHSIDDQITLVPLLAPLDQEELPLSDDRIANMLTELAESFDLVIVDVGHMSSPNSLVQALADREIINAAIAVVDYRNSTAQRVDACLRRIRQAGVNSIGLVENFAA